MPKKAGYDSHLGYVLRGVREVHSTDAGCRDDVEASRRWPTNTPTQEGDGAPQLVFFDTDQVLPCHLVDQRNHTRAHAALERAVKVVAENGERQALRRHPEESVGTQGDARARRPRRRRRRARGAGRRAAAADGRRDAARPRRYR